MPIYEYTCRDCAQPFELVVQRSTKIECPCCESENLEKHLSVFGVGTGGNGNSADFAAMSPMAGACGTCGDPRGPGSCSN